MNHIGGVMVSVLASSVADDGFDHPSGQTKDWTIGIAKSAICSAISWREKVNDQ
jgi:hypothetical protein